jgi:hypothetical protein
MKRSEVLDWLIRHTEHVHDVPERVLSRCEAEVRKHAQEDAWLHARDIAEEHKQDWCHAWGAHASETYVAREVCRDLADEFNHNEPFPVEGHESAFVDEDVLGVLDSEARTIILDYVHDLALGEEHQAWKEIVRFTRRRGQTLACEKRLSSDVSFEGTHAYSETAIRIMGILAHDFQHHARAQ